MCVWLWFVQMRDQELLDPYVWLGIRRGIAKMKMKLPPQKKKKGGGRGKGKGKEKCSVALLRRKSLILLLYPLNAYILSFDIRFCRWI